MPEPQETATRKENEIICKDIKKRRKASFLCRLYNCKDFPLPQNHPSDGLHLTLSMLGCLFIASTLKGPSSVSNRV